MNEIEYRLKINIACAIKNTLTLICFTILAIVFNKWWIVFFSALFWCSVEKDDKKKENNLNELHRNDGMYSGHSAKM